MNQVERVQRHMEDFGTISSLEAFRDYGITRLSAKIFELRKNGVAVGSRFEETTNRYGEKVRYAKYFLEEGEKQNGAVT